MKVWIIISLCLNTKAISLQLAPVYSTEDFMLAMRVMLVNMDIHHLSIQTEDHNWLLLKENYGEFLCVVKRIANILNNRPISEEDFIFHLHQIC